MRYWRCDEGNIAELAYDVAQQRLAVVFRDVPEYRYTYENIGITLFAQLFSAESIGSFFAKAIRPMAKKYPFTKSLAHPKATKHNHVTRDIKAEGKCPGCDEYHESVRTKAKEKR